MSLNSSLSKITSFTSKLTSFTPNNLRANIPSNAFTDALGIGGESMGFGSISEIKQSIGLAKQSIAQAATLGWCSFVLFEDGGKTALGVLTNIATGAMAIVTDIYQQVMQAIAAQVSAAVGQIIGAITSIVSALQNLVTSVLILAEGILGVFNSWLDWSDFQIELEIERQNCKDVLSSIAACYLNKLLGPYIEQFTSKIVGKINQVGNTFNSELYNALQDTNTLASFANQEAFLLQKASIQIKGLTKENLLGS